MKKIGIMTWYHWKNYGSVLQASALVYILKKLQYDPYLINYFKRKAYETRLTKKDIFKKIKIIILNHFNPDYLTNNQKTKFDSYINSRCKQTEACNTYSELHNLNEKLDAFVCGSDQIWAPSSFDDKYFLSFVDDPLKIVAYSPSIGLNDFKNKQIKEYIGQLVRRFKFISVREEEGKDLLNSSFGVDPTVVLDPTLLLDADEWSSYAKIKKEAPKSKYLLCYFLGGNRYRESVKKIARALNLEIYEVKTKKRGTFQPFQIDMGPEEFLYAIKNASYICTDSFHGTVFSIIFKIPFTVYERFSNNNQLSQNSRIRNILKITNLEDRLVAYNQPNILPAIDNCNFKKAEKNLINARQRSLRFLKEAISTASQKEWVLPTVKQTKEITKLCCGCASCSTICPKQAIRIELDSLGFQQAKINIELCINCGMCKQICPMNHIDAINFLLKGQLFAFKSLNKKVLLRSSSGGAAYIIGKKALESGMSVCGCSYIPETNCAKHILIDNISELTQLQGSKYLQSHTDDVLPTVFEKLKRSEKILFIGTPCQVAGVSNIANKLGVRKNLLLIDLICHGVPTEWLWTSYTNIIKKENHLQDFSDVQFRYKQRGWRNLHIYIQDKSGSAYCANEHIDPFYSFFRHNSCNMLSCYECPYRDKSSADLRLGDYWGKKFRKDKTGVSMVVSVTEKGKKTIELIRQAYNDAYIKEQPIEEYKSVQYPYNLPIPLFRNELINELKKNSNLKEMKRKYCDNYELQELLRKLLR